METVIAKIKLRRGTAEDAKQVIFDEGEIAYITDSQRIIVGDGYTNGGITLPIHFFDKTKEDATLLANNGDLLYTNNVLYWYEDNVWHTVSTLPAEDGGLSINNGELSINSQLPLYTDITGLNIDYNKELFRLNSDNKLDIGFDDNVGEDTNRNPLSCESGNIYLKYDHRVLTMSPNGLSLPYGDPIGPVFDYDKGYTTEVGSNGVTYYLRKSDDVLLEDGDWDWRYFSVRHNAPLKIDSYVVPALTAIPSDSVSEYLNESTVENYPTVSIFYDKTVNGLTLSHTNSFNISDEKLALTTGTSSILGGVKSNSSLYGITIASNGTMSVNRNSGVFVTAAEKTQITTNKNNITALSANKVNVSDYNTTVNNLESDIDTKAPKNNPTFTGTVSGISKTMVGLGNVDNTTDVNKPISTATQTALNNKASLSGATFTGNISANNIYADNLLYNTEIFVGVLSAWDALTTTQQLKYQTVYIYE